MTKIEKFVIAGILGAVALLAGIGIYKHYHMASFGSTVPNVPAQFETSLSIPQGTSDTSMTLASATLGNGSNLSGYTCFTVDSNTPLNEYECGTPSTTLPTLITGLVRGVDPQYGTTSVASLIFSHRVGADVRVTDFPFSTIVAGILNGQQAITQPILYSGVSTSTLQTNNNYLASVGYANSIAVAGAPNASLSQQGLVQQATALQLAASTNSGSTGAILFAPGGVFASSSSSTTLVPVTQTNGKLNQNFFDLTQAFTFTGNLTDTAATTTLAATSTKPLILDGVTYSFPFTQGTSNTFLSNNGSGTLSWATSTASFATSSVISSGTATATVNTVYTTTFLPSTITVYYNLGGSDSSNTAKNSQGVAVYKLGTLLNNYYTLLSGTTATAFNTSAPTSGVAGGVQVTLTITSLSSTGFTVSLAVLFPSGGLSAQNANLTIVANP